MYLIVRFVALRCTFSESRLNIFKVTIASNKVFIHVFVPIKLVLMFMILNLKVFVLWLN